MNVSNPGPSNRVAAPALSVGGTVLPACGAACTAAFVGCLQLQRYTACRQRLGNQLPPFANASVCAPFCSDSRGMLGAANGANLRAIVRTRSGVDVSAVVQDIEGFRRALVLEYNRMVAAGASGRRRRRLRGSGAAATLALQDVKPSEPVFTTEARPAFGIAPLQWRAPSLVVPPAA